VKLKATLARTSTRKRKHVIFGERDDLCGIGRYVVASSLKLSKQIPESENQILSTLRDDTNRAQAMKRQDEVFERIQEMGGG
jgi:hypothetical protein